MDEFSLYVLDITMNSVRAGADRIEVSLDDDGEILTFKVTDNGCGMTKSQVDSLTDPFFTTRKTRKVGFGIPFLSMLAEMTGGSVKITSKSQMEYPDCHGTEVVATFGINHIDFIPIGNIAETFVTLIQGSPEIDFVFEHRTPKGKVRLATADLREILGDDVSLSEYEVLMWIREYLAEGYEIIKK